MTWQLMRMLGDSSLSPGVCTECRQPHVGGAALLLARVHQRLKALEAMVAQQTAAAALESGSPDEGRAAAHLREFRQSR